MYVNNISKYIYGEGFCELAANSLAVSCPAGVILRVCWWSKDIPYIPYIHGNKELEVGGVLMPGACSDLLCSRHTLPRVHIASATNLVGVCMCVN